MNTLPRWIARFTLAPLAVLTLQGVVFNAQALTDTNAEMKEAAAARPAAVARTQPTAPVQTVWVPATPKSLDGFKPVLPPEPATGADGTKLAKADAFARSKKQ